MESTPDSPSRSSSRNRSQAVRALGSTIGSGSGRAVATAGGAVLGGIAGSAVEKNVTTVVGLEMEVELDNGELILIVQEKDDDFRVGDRVRVIRDARGGARVRQ